MTMSSEAGWPVLRRYRAGHLARVAMPLGGIGTGTVSLGGRGDLRDWEVVNRPAKGFAPPHSFFALRAQPAGGPAVARLLEGPLDAADFQGPLGSTARNHGLPRFRECEFAAAYPLGQVLLSDPDVPLHVRIEAFNPLVPGDADTSGMPFAALRVVLTNPGPAPVAASVVATLQNFIGTDGAEGAPDGNVNTFRETAGLRGIVLESRGVDPAAPQSGTLALATTAERVTYRTAWALLSWGDTLLDFWDDFVADGRLDQRAADGEPAPIAALAAELEVPPGETRAITFLLAWHFPNRQCWTPGGQGAWLQLGACASGAPTIGNFYTTQYADAWDAAERAAARLGQLEDATVRFVRAFCASDMPAEVQEAALFNLSTLRSQTCFRTPDGRFWGWEGCFDHHGSCYGSCTHVWNYEQATAHLFGELARSMREVEFAHATRDNGFMSFRVHLPLEYAQAGDVAAADGQMGCIMKLYRDWQLAGDDAFLRALWPKARKALEFCWVPGGWDADRDGVMEGCQHNTMDVEYYGPNPEMGFWYLGALRAAEAMARYLGEAEFADTCAGLFARGRAWVEQHLFNGEYYEHEIRPIRDAALIAPGLRHADLGARDLSDPELQLGAGCLTDQLVGQLMAHVCGLGYLADPEQIRSALASIMRYNFRQELHGHFNHLRTYALADEPGLLVASYPLGRRPTRPFPYCNEVWTGLEYTAAAHMLYEGRREDGLRVIGAVRSRFEGARRSPFDEAECGHHYARAMASWAAVLALSGFGYSGVTGALAFAGAGSPQRMFWSNGAAWGTCAQTPTAGGVAVELEVLHGQLKVAQLSLGGVGAVALDTPRTLQAGERLEVDVPRGAAV